MGLVRGAVCCVVCTIAVPMYRTDWQIAEQPNISAEPYDNEQVCLVGHAPPLPNSRICAEHACQNFGGFDASLCSGKSSASPASPI